MEQKVARTPALRGEIVPPGDKSISHRALILNGIAAGMSEVSGFLPSADCLATLVCMRSLGAEIEQEGTRVTVRGVGAGGLAEPSDILDARNSGTTMRLLAGLLAAQPFFSVITGDESLRSRPMDRIIKPLGLMGAEVMGRANNTRAPLAIKGTRLRGVQYRLPVASAQVKSAILLAGLFADGDTVVEQPALSRDHTERMLRDMGADLKAEGTCILLSPLSSPLAPLTMQIPGDISSAALWLVAGALHPDARLTVRNAGLNPTRSGIIDVLRSMGANLRVANERSAGGEPVGDLAIESSSLRGTEIAGELVPRAIDEIPVLAVAASLADGKTVIRDARELRVKETDRISVLATELSKFGAHVQEFADGMAIEGVPKLTGCHCDSHGDHRLAMALAVAGLVAEGQTTISNAEAVDISYPLFWEDLVRLSG